MEIRLMAILCVAVFGVAAAQPAPPEPCGTLDLSSPSTQHCFPADGSHHFVCCVDIQTADNPFSPHGNMNPLGRAITAASNESSWSWCTCSEEICTEQLRGRVQFNMQGEEWKGFRPRQPGVLSAAFQ